MFLTNIYLENKYYYPLTHQSAVAHETKILIMTI